MNWTSKPDPELAAFQAEYDAKAAREGLPAIHFWNDPCKEVDFSDWDLQAARKNSLS
jgi:hypothetical protein